MRDIGILRVRSLNFIVREGEVPEDSIAETDFTTLTITFKPGLSREVFLMTLCHEVIHIQLWTLGRDDMGEEVEESLAHGLGLGLYDFLMENPRFLSLVAFRP